MSKYFDIKEMGNRIKYTRKSKGITQERLAEMSEISTSFLYGIERGTKYASLPTFAKIAVALNEPADYILFGTHEIKSATETHIEIERMLAQHDETTATKVRDLLVVLLPML